MLGSLSILVYTKKQRQQAYNPSVIDIAPKRFNKVKTFYSPKYPTDQARHIPDYRSTIYWNANVKTGKSGKTKVDYFNADAPGQYKVIVE